MLVYHPEDCGEEPENEEKATEPDRIQVMCCDGSQALRLFMGFYDIIVWFWFFTFFFLDKMPPDIISQFIIIFLGIRSYFEVIKDLCFYIIDTPLNWKYVPYGSLCISENEK